ncbi:BTB/POZ domain-containing protein At3g56230 isoform X2 [Selaginella moellendorffii]|uniref:BTB/POZ domain-containing protein At3g56230 isoform X2 n=1 Tax=Selaginella moellendorffii TaxID=88036 RepID=UPI000D1CD83D|nr:BTB/POZ domain-containing protein At3g56230 isoform X2 [Selaginella moellendorffii]|eukprot:XP_024530096.1 BTB/POZ domain-containing protein At3g56230 isoform X2 [Selaginella moellendorffii]
MDCCVCSSVVVGTIAYRPPRNTICAGCLEGAQSILSVSSRIEQNWKLGEDDRQLSSKIMLLHASKRIEHLELMEREASRKLRFLESLAVGFREGIHTDVELVANDGHSIRAHRIVLVLFEVDACKSEHSGAVMVPELLNHSQLENFIEFLYSARISDDDLSKNSASLLVAADKYDIPALARTCEEYLTSSVTSSNALEMLELATLCSAEALKESAVKTVIDDYQTILFSKEYEEFALRSSMVALEISRAVISHLSSLRKEIDKL